MRTFSGIQPTGSKHLGNFIGAIRGWVEGQERGEAIYCLVDLHAITVSYEPARLRETVLDTTAILLASGLDPDRCILFRQGDVPEHTELCWLLQAVTAYGDLQRMTQFKDKSAAQKELVSAGIFNYPILQAADILAYNADEVPVGEDQRQHLELARDVAQRFNARFGDTFVLPEARIPTVGARIMDLQEPGNKMSTTAPSDAGVIRVLDDPKTVEKKVKSAVTDSGSDVRRSPDKPGITNLIDILAVIRGVEPEDIENEFDGSGYGQFKQAVAEAVVDYLAPVRERYNELRPDEEHLHAILHAGAQNAHAIAQPIVALARDRMGVGPPS
jgi:tryptophanyl-tRNA synthetase